MKEAMYQKQVPVGKVRCVLCPHRCLLANNKMGLCLVRENKDGVLYTKVYEEVSSYTMDPIEKKPLYHFYPGSQIFSVGSWGCNMKCNMCQNWNISQQQVATEHFKKEDLVEIAIQNDSIGIAFTYNEPVIWYEYVLDTAKVARDRGLKTVLVTNGFISEEPLKELLPHIDAMNIDLKGCDESYYREVCGGQLAPVMRTIRLAHEFGTHIELTNLVVPTLNDRPEDILEIVQWVASISRDIPLHFTRYFPQYKMDIEPTEVPTLIAAQKMGMKQLNYVYIGNVPSESGGSDTMCPSCGNLVIKRKWPDIGLANLKDGKCGHCGEKIAGKF